MEPFVLSGKAKTVFRIIELAAKREQELANILKTRSCPISKTAVCNKSSNIPCSEARCPVWNEIDGE